MPNPLIAEFEKTQLGTTIAKMVQNAEHIVGANDFYAKQGHMFEAMRKKSAIFEWQVRGEPDVLIMPADYGRALLAHTDLPLVTSHMQYPKKEFTKTRHGKMAYGFEKKSGIVAIMINKDIVLGLIDPVRAAENEMQQLVGRIGDIMQETGMSAQEIMQELEKIKAHQHDESDNTPQI